MKKSKLFLVVAILLAFLFGGGSRLFALDFSIGTTAWYSWVMPYYLDDISGENGSTLPGAQANLPVADGSYNNNDGLGVLFPGLLLSVTMHERITISAVFLYSTQNRVSGEYILDGPADIAVRTTVVTNRWDLDITIGYKLNDSIKIFAGFKYLGYTGCSDLVYLVLPPAPSVGGADFDIWGFSAGPALGFGLTIPLYGNIYLLFNVSGIYVRYVHNRKGSEAGLPDYSFLRFSNYGFGSNSSLSFAYYFESLKTTITLGWRYQVLASWNEIYDEYGIDHFYGIQLSAIYTF